VACSAEPSDSVAGESADIKANTKVGAHKVTSCFGTEPFWRITIDDKAVKFDDLAGATRTIENAGPKAPTGVGIAFSALYQGRTNEDPNRFLNVVVTESGPGGCRHGVGEEPFAYDVTVLSGTEFFLGCCK